MVEYEVFGLYVPMDNAVVVNVLETRYDAGDEELWRLGARRTGFDFREAALLAEVEAEVAAREQVHQEVEVLAVLEGVLHVHDEPGRWVRWAIAYGCFSCMSSFCSLMTEWIDFFMIMRDLLISFIAKALLSFLRCTRHTLPKPPRPITYSCSNWFFVIAARG